MLSFVTRRSFLAQTAIPLMAASPFAKLNYKAPELEGKDWLNAPGGPLHLRDRAGLVTVVHFWTYMCINCKRNLPIYGRWHTRFAAQQVEVIGIHSPEFPAEAIAKNVEKRAKEFGIVYPVLLDPALKNWNRWNQQVWPCVYLIGRNGKVRYRWDGEMNYGQLDGERKMTALIEELLAEKV
ncbi:MAG: redoxin domain-containing protein [Candidatus Solibacter usitatus]|nr:redoxin domain-containing protein [Candidatus Solibacter usitatus]